jgi:hypothetical protein
MDNIFCKFDESMNNSESFFGGGQVYKFPKLSASSNKYNRVKGSQWLQISFKKENQKSLLIALLKVR